VARILKLAAADITTPPEPAKVRAAFGVARTGESMIYLIDAERILRPDPTAEVQPTRSDQA
jgi:hypothetical protein